MFLTPIVDMKLETRLRLNRINRDFYARTASDFDATRQRAWAGWRDLLAFVDLPLESVLDLGCGNGRFGRFIADSQREPFVYSGCDNNQQLLESAREQLSAYTHVTTRLIEMDIISGGLPETKAQMVALFGLLHHVPGYEHRRELVAEAAARTLPGGWLVFTAWRFLEDEKLRRRVMPWSGEVAIEKNDFLLDWRRGQVSTRYCHYIDDDEHEALVNASGLTLVADYRADGASGRLNRYAVLRKRARPAKASPA